MGYALARFARFEQGRALMTTRRYATAFAAILLAPMTLLAEPLPPGVPIATYTTTLLYATGQTALYHGPSQFDNEFTNTTFTVHGYTYLPGTMNGTIDSPSSEIRLAGQLKGSYFFDSTAPTPGSPNDTNRFVLRVEVMDLASGGGRNGPALRLGPPPPVVRASLGRRQGRGGLES